MKTLILTENGMNNLKKQLIKEAAYEEYVRIGKDFLDKNYIKATRNNNGKVYGVFIQKDQNMPTDKTLWKQDVLDNLDREFYNTIKDNKEREWFVNQLLNDWYYGTFTKYGNLSKYN